MHCWYAVLVCCCSAVACAEVKLGMHIVETLLVRVTAPAYCAVSLLPVLSCGDAEPLSGKLKLRGGVAALAAVSVTEYVGTPALGPLPTEFFCQTSGLGLGHKA